MERLEACITFASLMLATIFGAGFFYMLPRYKEGRERLKDMLADDNRLITLLAERAKRQIDEEVRREAP